MRWRLLTEESSSRFMSLSEMVSSVLSSYVWDIDVTTSTQFARAVGGLSDSMCLYGCASRL